jgi:hypothetical protein
MADVVLVVIVPAKAIGVTSTTKFEVVAILLLQVPEVTIARNAVETLKLPVDKFVLVPDTAVHVGVAAFQLVDFCHAIVPTAFAKVNVVPFPAHTVENPVILPAIAGDSVY